MKDARPANRDAYSRLASQISISRGSIHGRLFIPETDETNTKIETLLANIGHWKSRKAEYNLHIEVMECLSDELCSVYHDCDTGRLKGHWKIEEQDVQIVESEIQKAENLPELASFCKRSVAFQIPRPVLHRVWGGIARKANDACLLRR